MFTQNENEQDNCHIIETESKTKSSSIKDEKEKIKTNINSNKKKKNMKRNKTSSLTFKNVNMKLTQSISKNDNYLNIGDNEKTNNIIKKDDILSKTMKSEAINYIKINYNLAEAYLKNNMLEKLQSNKGLHDYKGISDCNTYNFIKIKRKINNNFNKTNYNKINNYMINDFDNQNPFKYYNEEQMEEDDYKNYTVSYRYKMINELKKKLNKDNIINESINELQFDTQTNNVLYDKNKFEKNKIINNKKESNIKKVKNINDKNKKDKNKNIIKNQKIVTHEKKYSNLENIKNKDIKNIFENAKKDDKKGKKPYLLIKDLLDDKIYKSSFIINNDKINIDNCYTQSFRKKSSKIKNKNNLKNKENIFSLEINKSKNNDNFNKTFINSIINKVLESQISLKNKTINNQTLSGNAKKKGCIIKNNNKNQLTSKNSLTNILNIKTKNIKSKSFNKYNKWSIKNHNKGMILYNIKNQIINNRNNDIFNRTMIKDNKYIKQPNLIKDKNTKDNNKTPNINKKHLNMSHNNYNNLYFTKNNNKKSIYCKIIKNKTKMKSEFIKPNFPPSFFEDNKFNTKDNIYKNMNLTTIINKTNNNNDESFKKNKINNKNKNKTLIINENNFITIEEKDTKINFPKNKKFYKSKGNN